MRSVVARQCRLAIVIQMLDSTRVVKEKGWLLRMLIEHGSVLTVLLVVEADFFGDEQVTAVAGLVLRLGFFSLLVTLIIFLIGICLLIFSLIVFRSGRRRSSSPVIIIDPTHFIIYYYLL